MVQTLIKLIDDTDKTFFLLTMIRSSEDSIITNSCNELCLHFFPVSLKHHNTLEVNYIFKLCSYKNMFFFSPVLFQMLSVVSTPIIAWLNQHCRPSAHSFTLRGHKFFKKGHLQDRLKQLSLEKDPGHNTR